MSGQAIQTAEKPPQSVLPTVVWVLYFCPPILPGASSVSAGAQSPGGGRGCDDPNKKDLRLYLDLDTRVDLP